MSAAQATWVVALLLLVALFAVLRLGSRHLGEMSGVPLFVDPDSAMYFHVTRLSMESGLPVRWLADDNAPFGCANGWSSAHTLWLRLVAALFGGGDAGLAGMKEWASFVQGAIAFAALVAIAVAAGRPWLGLGFAAGMTFALPLANAQGAGFLDHHTSQATGVMLALAALLLGRERPLPWLACLAGAAQGWVLWISPLEQGPLLALVSCLALHDVVRGGSPGPGQRFWRCWAGAGCMVVMAGLALDWRGDARLEVLHPIHLLAWAAIWVALELATRATTVRGRLAAAGLGYALGAVATTFAALATRDFDPSRLLVLSDPRFVMHERIIEEFRSLPLTWEALRDQVLGFNGLLVLAPLAGLILLRLSRKERVGVVFASVVGVMYLGLLFEATRWVRPVSAALAVTGPYVLAALVADRRWSAGLLAASLALPGHVTFDVMLNQLAAQQTKTWIRPRRQMAAWSAAEHLRVSRSAEKPILLLGLGDAPYVLANGGAATVGSLYWSNLDGQVDHALMFTTTDDAELRVLFAKRRIGFILQPPDSELALIIAKAMRFREGFGSPISEDRVRATAMWRLIESGRLPVVPGSGVERAAPGWKLLDAGGYR